MDKHTIITVDNISASIVKEALAHTLTAVFEIFPDVHIEIGFDATEHDVTEQYSRLGEENANRGSKHMDTQTINNDMLIRHICENCGKEELLTSEEGHDTGWDYPPRMGSFGVISARTCGSCTIDTTLWWQLEVLKTPVEKLSEKHLQTLERILSEPMSILPSRDTQEGND